jgi:hypothetical protein
LAVGAYASAALTRNWHFDEQYLIARLLQIENDIRAMGYSPEEVEKNEFTYAPDKTVVSKQYYVPLPSWIANDKK